MQPLGFQVSIFVLLVHTTIGISSDRDQRIALLLELVCIFFPNQNLHYTLRAFDYIDILAVCLIDFCPCLIPYPP